MRTSTDPLGSLLSHRYIIVLSRYGKLTRYFVQAFLYHHNQHWKAVCLISISFSLITFKKFNINIQDLHQEDWTFFNIFAISVVWSLLRLFGILDNSVDDLDIFSKYNPKAFSSRNHDFRRKQCRVRARNCHKLLVWLFESSTSKF